MEKKVKPNWDMVKKQTGFDKKTAIAKLNEKVTKVTRELLVEDLSPFIDDPAFIEDFAQNYPKLLQAQISGI